jgi:primosomal replication protein N
VSNKIILRCTVTFVDAIRYTPSGQSVLQLRYAHHSRQLEAGILRDVRCEGEALLMGNDVKYYAGQLQDKTVTLTGFLSQRSLRSTKLILHIQHLDIES